MGVLAVVRGVRPSALGWVLMVALALVALASATVQVRATDYDSAPLFTIGNEVVTMVVTRGVDAVFVVWSQLPLAAMGAVVFYAERWGGGGRAVKAALVMGVAVVSGFTVVALADFVGTTSSTGGLIFLFLPLYQTLLVALSAAAAFGAGALRCRRSSPR